jgi:hypothetical protein
VFILYCFHTVLSCFPFALWKPEQGAKSNVAFLQTGEGERESESESEREREREGEGEREREREREREKERERERERSQGDKQCYDPGMSSCPHMT